MISLAFAAGCAKPEETPESCPKTALIAEIRAEYLDADRLTDADVNDLSDGRTEEERTLVLAFQQSLSDDALDETERQELARLGVCDSDIPAADWQQPWLKQFSPLLTDVSFWHQPGLWAQSFNNEDYQRKLFLAMGEIDFKNVPAEARLDAAKQVYAYLTSTPIIGYWKEHEGFQDEDALRAFANILSVCDREAVPFFAEILRDECPPCRYFERVAGDKDSHTNLFLVILTRWSEIAVPEDQTYAKSIKQGFGNANRIYSSNGSHYSAWHMTTASKDPAVIALFAKLGENPPDYNY
jgi:hypothetical protein